MRSILFAVLILVAFDASSKADQNDEYSNGIVPHRLSQWPDALKDYQELPESRSPDGKYGFIYPKRNVVEEMSDPKLYLARLSPFQITATIPVKYGNLCENTGSGYSVEWASDSSDTLFYVDGKKGPFHIFVATLENGGVASLVDLETPIRKLVQDSYVRSQAPRFNDYFDFIMTDGDFIRDVSGKVADVKGYWSLNNHGQVIVKCFCTNDPKHLSKIMWEVAFEGLWDIHRGQFASYHIDQIPQARIPSLDDL